MTGTEQFVLTEVVDQVGWITLNEPGRLNPIRPSRIRELNEECRSLSARDEVRVVVITGAGRGFCSGADFDAPYERPGPASDSMLDEGPGMWTLTAVRQPVVAMVNGPAVGYGAELAIQADFRIAGSSALFVLPFGQLGVVSDTGAATWLLPRLIGWSKAAELLYLGRRVTGDEAVAIGLANYVVPDEELRAFTTAFARDLASRSPLSLIQLKRMIFAGLEERKAEHVLRQHIYFQRRDPAVDVARYAKGARGGSRWASDPPRP
jgi:enoyl-CoA hydratase/carnithine racemase